MLFEMPHEVGWQTWVIWTCQGHGGASCQMAYISCSLGASLMDSYWYCNAHIMPLNVGWIYGWVMKYPHQNKWQVIEKNHENKRETQFCCDSRCQGAIGVMVCNDGIFKCASFENFFFVYIQQNNYILL